jgi:GNAT superfamily N-acetyltransferase
MPGATRIFDSNAARQRAYRRRKAGESTAVLEEAQETQMWAYLVQAAVEAARKSGDPLAKQVYDADAFETLRALADHFYDQAGTPYPARPWGSWPRAAPSETIPAPPDSRPGGTHL